MALLFVLEGVVFKKKKTRLSLSELTLQETTVCFTLTTVFRKLLWNISLFLDRLLTTGWGGGRTYEK